LLKAEAVAGKLRVGFGLSGERTLGCLRSPLEAADYGREQPWRIDVLDPKREMAVVGAGDQQQVFSQLGEPVDFLR
jgi:hypothetical protein